MSSPSGPLTNTILSQIATKNIDLKQRRVVNAANAVNGQDYVTQVDLNNAIAQAISTIRIPTPVATTTTSSSGFTVQKLANPWLLTPTSTRVLGTVYQNTTGKSVVVSVTASTSTGGVVLAFCDTNSTPTTGIASGGNIAGAADLVEVTFIVLPNYYCKVSGGSLSIWVETQ